jgi:multiple sugar transport system permease protein
MAGWLAVTVGLALLGPLSVALAAWGARAAVRPQRLRETVAAWGFLAPSALHLCAFSFAPILFALYLSMHRWTLVDPARPFVGLANLTRMVHDPLVWISLRNTALYVLYVPASMILSLGAALAVHRQSWVVRLARTIFCLPYVSSVVAIALVWQWMYQPDVGVINYLLSALGLRPLDWLGSPRTALLAVMIVSVWVQLGYQMTVFLAGLQGVPHVYLDAARVDGASAWQRFRRITLPLLRPVTLFVLVTGVIGSLQVFTYIYVLTGGGPLHATDVIAYRIYQTGWEFLQFGYASALSLLLFVLLFGVTRAQFMLLGKREDYA